MHDNYPSLLLPVIKTVSTSARINVLAGRSPVRDTRRLDAAYFNRNNRE